MQLTRIKLIQLLPSFPCLGSLLVHTFSSFDLQVCKGDEESNVRSQSLMKAAFTFGVNANTTTKKCEQKITPFFKMKTRRHFLLCQHFLNHLTQKHPCLLTSLK